VFRCHTSRSCILSSRVFSSGRQGVFSLKVRRSESQPLRTRLFIQNVSSVFISDCSLTHTYGTCQVPHTVLCRPCRSKITLADELLEKLVIHFKILFSTQEKRLTANDVRPYVCQAQIDQWGKVRRAFGGDTIQSVMAMERRDNVRDSSFVRVSVIIVYFLRDPLLNTCTGVFLGDYRQGRHKSNILWPGRVLLGLPFSFIPLDTRRRPLHHRIILTLWEYER